MSASCDGDAYIRNLASFIRSNERQLANALLAFRRNPAPANARMARQIPVSVKPVRLSLSLHHLFYLLSRFQEYSIPSIGPLNIRLENIHNDDGHLNYVSFLSDHAYHKSLGSAAGGSSDAASIHSVSSIRSVMSSMSTLWNGISAATGTLQDYELEAQLLEQDIKYIYSAFTKLPCLRVAPDWKAKLIEGYEEYPFDTAVPLLAFKNLSVLELNDVDIKEVFGWDTLAEQLRFLIVKRARLQDICDLIFHAVLADAHYRASTAAPAASATPAAGWHALHDGHRRRTRSGSRSATRAPAGFSPDGSAALPNSLPVISDRAAHHSQPSLLLLAEEPETAPRVPSAVSKFKKSASSVTLPGYGHAAQSGSQRSARSAASAKSTASGRSARSDSLSSASSGNSSSVGATAVSQASETDVPPELQLPGMKWRFLKHLSLAENCIQNVAPYAFSPLAESLTSLDLSHNQLDRIPEAVTVLSSLKSLNVSHNRISVLPHFPTGLKTLTSLNLRGNRLANVEGIESFPRIEKIDLRDNLLEVMADLSAFYKLENVTALWVSGNSIAKRGHGGWVRSASTTAQGGLLADSSAGTSVDDDSVANSANSVNSSAPMTPSAGSAPISASKLLRNALTFNYRVELFNMFRSIPGYRKDVVIDGSGPGIFEQRYLLDRAKAVAARAARAAEAEAEAAKEAEAEAEAAAEAERLVAQTVGQTNGVSADYPLESSSDSADDGHVSADAANKDKKPVKDQLSGSATSGTSAGNPGTESGDKSQEKSREKLGISGPSSTKNLTTLISDTAGMAPTRSSASSSTATITALANQSVISEEVALALQPDEKLCAVTAAAGGGDRGLSARPLNGSETGGKSGGEEVVSVGFELGDKENIIPVGTEVTGGSAGGVVNGVVSGSASGSTSGSSGGFEASKRVLETLAAAVNTASSSGNQQGIVALAANDGVGH